MVKTRANTPKPVPAEITIASFVLGKGVAINRKSFYTEIWMLKGCIYSWNTFCINHKKKVITSISYFIVRVCGR